MKYQPLYRFVWFISAVLLAYIVTLLYFNLKIYPKALYYKNQPSSTDRTSYNAGDVMRITFTRCSNGSYMFTATRKLVDDIEIGLLPNTDRTSKGCVEITRAVPIPIETFTDTYHFEGDIRAQVKWFIFSRELEVKTVSNPFKVQNNNIDVDGSVKK